MQWKIIPSYPNYEASNCGQIRNKKTQKILKQKLSNGYCKLDVYNNKIRKTVYVHRLIAETFLLNWDENLQVDHIDRNKINNNINNLRMSIDVINLLNRKQYKSIQQLDINGQVIYTYDNIAEIIHGILNACISNQEFNGYLWKYEK